jgi:hypothetical protein
VHVHAGIFRWDGERPEAREKMVAGRKAAQRASSSLPSTQPDRSSGWQLPLLLPPPKKNRNLVSP